MKNLLNLLVLLMLVCTFTSCMKEDLIIPDTVQDTEVITNDVTPGMVLAKDIISPADLDITLTSVDIMAGQNILVGTSTIGVYSDPKTLEHYLAIFVDMTPMNTNTGTTWAAGTTHIYAGPTNLIPLNGAGNPQIGNFPYGADVDIGDALADMDAGTYNPMSIYTMPLEPMVDPAAGDYCFDILVHAEVFEIDGDPGDPKNPLTIVSSETAWASGMPLTPKMLKGGAISTSMNKGSWAMYNTTCLN